MLYKGDRFSQTIMICLKIR